MEKRHATLSLVFLMLAVSCSAETSTHAGSGQAEAPKPTKQVLKLVLPFDKYELTQQDSYAVAEARDFLIRECMKKRGYEWNILHYPSRVDEIKNRRRYGVVEIQVARDFGYHVNSAILSGETDVPRQHDEREKRLGGDGIKAAYSEKSGCGYKANSILDEGGGSVNYHLFNRLSSELLIKAKRNSEVARVTRRWAKCMRGHGYTYTTPGEAIGDPRWWKKKSDKASSVEKSVAVADVQCKSQEKLVEALFEAEARLQEQAIKRHGAYFSKLSAAQVKYLGRVNEVIKVKGAP